MVHVLVSAQSSLVSVQIMSVVCDCCVAAFRAALVELRLAYALLAEEQ